MSITAGSLSEEQRQLSGYTVCASDETRSMVDRQLEGENHMQYNPDGNNGDGIAQTPVIHNSRSNSGNHCNSDNDKENTPDRNDKPDPSVPADLKEADRLTVIIRNIATLQVHKHEAAEAKCDILCLSEIDLPDYQMREVNETLSLHGWQRYYGRVIDIATEQGKRRGRRVMTAIQSPKDPVIIIGESDPDRLFLLDTGRWIETTIMLKDGSHLSIANIYGVSGASGKSHEYVENEILLAAAVRRAGKMRDHPYYIVGDFNTDTKNSKVLLKAMQESILFDIGAEWAPEGEDPQRTYSKDTIQEGMAGPGKTRIDLVMANMIGCRILEDIEYLYAEAQGFDHLPIKITLSVSAMKQEIRIMTKPQPINRQSDDPKIHND